MGITGQISFTEEGDRQDAMYEIMNVNTSRKQVAVGLFGGMQVSPTKVRVLFSILACCLFSDVGEIFLPGMW